MKRWQLSLWDSMILAAVQTGPASPFGLKDRGVGVEGFYSPLSLLVGAQKIIIFFRVTQH